MWEKDNSQYLKAVINQTLKRAVQQFYVYSLSGAPKKQNLEHSSVFTANTKL